MFCEIETYERVHKVCESKPLLWVSLSSAFISADICAQIEYPFKWKNVLYIPSGALLVTCT